MGRQNRYEENAKIPHMMSVYNATTVKPFNRHSTQNCTLRIIYTANGKAGFKPFMLEVPKSVQIFFLQYSLAKAFLVKYLKENIQPIISISLNHQSCKITQYSKIIVKSIRYPNDNF